VRTMRFPRFNCGPVRGDPNEATTCRRPERTAVMTLSARSTSTSGRGRSTGAPAGAAAPAAAKSASTTASPGRPTRLAGTRTTAPRLRAPRRSGSLRVHSRTLAQACVVAQLWNAARNTIVYENVAPSIWIA
jgi:hypothetical protein